MENVESLLHNFVTAPSAPEQLRYGSRNSMARILVADDEECAGGQIARNLSLIGHKCTHLCDGREAEGELLSDQYDLALINVRLPGRSGFELVSKANKTAVIFLTAQDDTTEKIAGLNLGAADYIAKPFDMIELLARINAVLRRTRRNAACFSLDGIMVDFDSHNVYKNGHAVELTPKEYELLEALVANKNLALSRESLLYNVWGYDYAGDTRTIDVHIQKLRKKLGWEHRIVTVYKMGYRLETNK